MNSQTIFTAEQDENAHSYQSRCNGYMTLKASFANVLRALRSKRNISQRDFADTTSRTYLSKLELGKSSVTLDKLGQLSQRLQLSPLTLLTLTLSEDTGQSVSDLMSNLQAELADLQRGQGLPSLKAIFTEASSPAPGRRLSEPPIHLATQDAAQAELAFMD